MSTIFSRIIQHEIPGTFVYRDDVCVAFLSINPLSHGHTLVVPIEEVDEWTDLDVDTASRIFEVSHKIGQAQKNAFSCERIGLIIAGYEVNHCHIHVFPTSDIRDFNFANAATTVSRESLDEAAKAIRSAMSSVGLTPSEY